MIIRITLPEDSEHKKFNAIFVCSNKNAKVIIDTIEDIDLMLLMHDGGEAADETTDPFNFKKIVFN